MTTPIDPDREILITRVFAAPRQLVWDVWTQPDHVARWFGPKGFDTRVTQLDLRPGGRSHYVMVGPDGTEYPVGGTFIEVVPPERIVTTDEFLEGHDYGKADLPQGIVLTALFEEVGEKQTKLTLRITHPTAEDKRKHAAMGVEAGWQSSFDKMDEYLAAGATADRELVIERLIDAPPDRVYRAFTDPAGLTHWWGPRGFRTTTHSMDVRVGGEWRFTMHGPDGTDYPNRVLYKEVVPNQRLVYDHGDPADARPPFHAEIHLTPADGKTRVTLLMRVGSPAEKAEFVKFGAVEGGQQTLERLDQHLAADREVVSTRVFDAPPAAVYRAFTDPDQLKRWWGPAGFTTTIHAFDPQPGGAWRFTMHGPDGTDYPNECVFVELAEPERVVFDHLEPVHRFRMSMTFTDQAGRTAVTWRMRFTTAAELARVREPVTAGNEQNFDRLAAVLAG